MSSDDFKEAVRKRRAKKQTVGGCLVVPLIGVLAALAAGRLIRR